MEEHDARRSTGSGAAPSDWTRGAVRPITGLIIITLAAAALTHSPGSRTPADSPAAHAAAAERKIDINRAGVEELQLLPGIGPAIAARIIEDREANGSFESVEALTRVRGVGPRTVINIAGLAIADDDDVDVSTPSAPATAAGSD